MGRPEEKKPTARTGHGLRPARAQTARVTMTTLVGIDETAILRAERGKRRTATAPSSERAHPQAARQARREAGSRWALAHAARQCESAVLPESETKRQTHIEPTKTYIIVHDDGTRLNGVRGRGGALLLFRGSRTHASKQNERRKHVVTRPRDVVLPGTRNKHAYQEQDKLWRSRSAKSIIQHAILYPACGLSS